MVKYNSDDEGMMTVEASVIVPLLWLVIAMLVFCSLFLLEMAATQSECMRISSELASTWKKGKEMEGAASDRLHRRISERVHMSTLKEYGVRADAEEVKAIAVIEFALPLNGIRKLFGVGEWGLHCSSTASVCRWEDILRGGGCNGDY